MKFNSLTVHDFMAESKEWDNGVFFENVRTHLEELKQLDTNNPIYKGCRVEIAHLIDFCNNILLQSENKETGILSDDDYVFIQDIFWRLENE